MSEQEAWGPLLERQARIALLLLVLANLAALFGSLGFPLELATHFPHLYLAAAVLLAGFLGSRGRRRSAMVGLVLVLLNLWPVLRLWLPPRTVAPGQRSLTLVTANVNAANPHYQRILDWVEREPPDLIAVLEVDETWLRCLAPLEQRYPFHLKVPRDDFFGIALYSRLPLRETRVLTLPGAEVPSLVARVGEGEGIWLAVTHPVPPVSIEMARMRNQQLAALAQLSAETDGPRVVTGDLNITPWSPFFRHLLSAGKLRDARQGLGIMGTWPAAVPLVRIPIDHVLCGGGAEVTELTIGPKLGSDHLPLRARIHY